MVYSEALLLAMIAKGADRQEAYRLVQGAAKRALANATAFRAELLGDAGVARVALGRRDPAGDGPGAPPGRHRGHLPAPWRWTG